MGVQCTHWDRPFVNRFAVQWPGECYMNHRRQSGLVGVMVANGSGDTLHHGKLWECKAMIADIQARKS